MVFGGFGADFEATPMVYNLDTVSSKFIKKAGMRCSRVLGHGGVFYGSDKYIYAMNGQGVEGEHNCERYSV